jgi:uncharacterized protein (TIGR02118 family)
MIKAITCIKRKPGLSVEDFQSYWLQKHPEFVKKLPNIRRYVQSHSLLGGYRKGELIYDGIAEVWVDSVEHLREMSRSSAYEDVLSDEEHFIDRPKMALILTEDHLIKEGDISPDGLKSIEFITRRAEMPLAEFQAYWKNTHGPIAAEIPALRRYVQSHALPGGYRDGRQPAWDGCAITWFDSIEDMRASALTDAFARTIADEPNFIQHAADGKVPTIITKAHLIVG